MLKQINASQINGFIFYSDLFDFLKETVLELDEVKEYISDKYMNNVNNCYKFLWIYTHKHEHEGVVVNIKELEELDRLYNEYFSPKAKDRIKDYFPTQVLDIAPTISKFSQDIHSGFLDKADVAGRKSVETYIKRIVDDVTSALKVSGHTYEKSLDRPKRISQDVVGILDSYANLNSKILDGIIKESLYTLSISKNRKYKSNFLVKERLCHLYL